MSPFAFVDNNKQNGADNRHFASEPIGVTNTDNVMDHVTGILYKAYEGVEFYYEKLGYFPETTWLEIWTQNTKLILNCVEVVII